MGKIGERNMNVVRKHPPWEQRDPAQISGKGRGCVIVTSAEPREGKLRAKITSLLYQ